MEITLQSVESETDLIEFSGSLTAEEAAELARGAYRRIASALRIDEEAAREKARFMLTDMEFNVLVEETVKARATDRAIRELGIAFLLEPSIRSTRSYENGKPYSIESAVYTIPSMELDLKTPIELTEELCAEPAAWKAERAGTDANAGNLPPLPISPALERHLLRTLRARLTGVVSATLESAAFARENKAFRTALEEDGETYREYRIRTGKKPQEVEAELRRGAMRQLYDEIALETVFGEQQLELMPEDETTVLREMAPGREEALRQELDNAGKLWMLAQKARRRKALIWIAENLTC